MGAGSPRAPTEASTTLSAQRGLGWPPGGGRARQGPWGDPQADALWAAAAASLAAVFRGWGKEQELPPPGYWAAEPTARPSQSVPSSQGSLCQKFQEPPVQGWGFRDHMSKLACPGCGRQEEPGLLQEVWCLRAGLKSEPGLRPPSSQARTEPRGDRLPGGPGLPRAGLGLWGVLGGCWDQVDTQRVSIPPHPAGTGQRAPLACGARLTVTVAPRLQAHEAR